MALVLRLLLLGAVALSGARCGPGTHSLRYFYTGVSEPGPGLPDFIAVGDVDGQRIDHYDSETRRDEPRADWMARNEDAQYWQRNTQIYQGWQATFRANLNTLRQRYNQSAGSHALQFKVGCELQDGRSTGGHWQYGYDGRDFISLDKETLTWTAADKGAQVTKRKWEDDKSIAQHRKQYLEQECVEWLRKYLEYGKETLQRKEIPAVKVLSKTAPHGFSTLSCRAHGFYPRDITVTWMKNGVSKDQETRRGGIVPNSDGTYHTWATIEIDPKETDLYSCHVDHESLEKPLDFFWEKDNSSSSLIPIVAGVIAVVAVVAVITGVVIWKKKSGKKAAGYSPPGSEHGSGSSAEA